MKKTFFYNSILFLFSLPIFSQSSFLESSLQKNIVPNLLPLNQNIEGEVYGNLCMYDPFGISVMYLDRQVGSKIGFENKRMQAALLGVSLSFGSIGKRYGGKGSGFDYTLGFMYTPAGFSNFNIQSEYQSERKNDFGMFYLKGKYLNPRYPEYHWEVKLIPLSQLVYEAKFQCGLSNTIFVGLYTENYYENKSFWGMHIAYDLISEASCLTWFVCPGIREKQPYIYFGVYAFSGFYKKGFKRTGSMNYGKKRGASSVFW